MFYLENKLIHQNRISLAGEPIDLEKIVQPLYAVGAMDDHITPWAQTFRIVNFVMASKRYVLSSSGHILGIINPPDKAQKRSYWVADAHRAETSEAWQASAVAHRGSWWMDWVEWLDERCGEFVPAPVVASEAFPALCQAPGSYVLEH
jgi:polyhydroxyalkanoate synthase